MNFYRNYLLDECISRFNKTYAMLLNTDDFVPDVATRKRRAFILKAEKKAWRQLNREYRRYMRLLRMQGDSIKKLFPSVLFALDNVDMVSSVTSKPTENVAPAENVTPAENVKPAEAAIPGEDTTPTENVTSTENINGGDCNVK